MLDTQVLWLPVEAIAPNPAQPRRDFDPVPLSELADSIRRHGILQPLSVRRTEAGWELVAGERRLRAAKLAGLSSVPCLRVEAEADESALLALIENIQRRDLHYLEEAAAIAAYLRRSGATQEEAAARLGRSPSALANKLRLLRLSPECCRLLVENGLTERHARALLRLEEPELQRMAARHVAEQGLTVARTEEYVEALLHPADKPARKKPTFVIKDVRLFLNTVTRGLSMMKSAGVQANCKRQETEDSILLTITIPK